MKLFLTEKRFKEEMREEVAKDRLQDSVWAMEARINDLESRVKYLEKLLENPAFHVPSPQPYEVHPTWVGSPITTTTSEEEDDG